ncbi:hypothetical protein Franean1_3577 [Parafrankia sp. EAN1pec]|nr:hypothetical protein Franean1_3577 [Frankia sp. EAN1pec]
MTAQPGGDGTGPFAVPASHDHLRPHGPVTGSMPRPGQLPDLLRVRGRAGIQQLRHERPPPDQHPTGGKTIYSRNEERCISQVRRRLRNAVDLTHHNKNQMILVQGPEITIRPVAARLLTRCDAE